MSNLPEEVIFGIYISEQPPYVTVEVNPDKKDWVGGEGELISILLGLTKEWMEGRKNAKS